MSFTILSLILFCFLLSPSFALVEVDLTRALRLEGFGGIRQIKQFEIELGKNCSSDLFSHNRPFNQQELYRRYAVIERRTIARFLSNNIIDDVRSIRIKIRWPTTVAGRKPALQFQIVQTKLGDEVKSGKPSQELQLIGCLLLTVTAAHSNEIVLSSRNAQQSNKWVSQFELSHLRDVDVIVRFPAKSSNSVELNMEGGR